MAGSESNSRSTNGQVHPDDESERSLNIGESGQIYADNAVYTSKYTLLTFLPKVSMKKRIIMGGLCMFKEMQFLTNFCPTFFAIGFA